MIGDAFDLFLTVLVLAVGVRTINARETYAAVVAFVTYGLLVSLLWVRLAAIDVALAEAAIGGGLTGVLMLGAAARLRAHEAAAPPARPSAALRAGAALLSAAVAALLAVAVLTLPDPAPSLAPDAAAQLAATGLGNPVTAVLLAFRALDTLLEKVVLLVALLAVWSLAGDGAWGRAPAVSLRSGPDGVLAFLARLLAPLGVLIGLFLLWTGADNPGGTFQAGAVLAAMWLLAVVAGLADPPRVDSRRLRQALTGGPLFFIAVGAFGSLVAGAFLAYPAGWAKPFIVAIEIALALAVAATLAMLLSGPPRQGSQR